MLSLLPPRLQPKASAHKPSRILPFAPAFCASTWLVIRRPYMLKGTPRARDRCLRGGAWLPLVRTA
jgi:hypothetical protein